MFDKVTGIVGSRAVGAAVAQMWQAVGSFGLQLAAAWALGAAGLGLLSLCLGVIFMATALTSGMVGDSLVVLDRADGRIRAALQAWALILGALTGLLAGAVMALTLLTVGEAVLFALALVAFQVEELIRRLLMATMHFWRLVVVDTVAVGSTLALVGGWHLVSQLSLWVFFAAMICGQLAGMVAGLVALPREERSWVGMRRGNLRAVAAFGVWRGAQVSVPPALLTAARLLIVIFASGAALGLVEAARIFVAPLLLVTQGLGSYLFSSYARDIDGGLTALWQRARRASLGMVMVVLGVGAALVALVPAWSHLITGPAISIDPVAVAGWVLYVAASASLQPFASLAAVMGRQRRVFTLRVVDAIFAAALLAILLSAGMPTAWAPYPLACGLSLGGILVRWFVLAPLIKVGASSSLAESMAAKRRHT